ncbi:MAG: DUF5684 domain-containing protein [Candidatus Oleimicrobiaceae bacterium]
MLNTYLGLEAALLQEEGKFAAAAAVGFLLVLFAVALAVFYIYVMWRVFVKAGKPGWACLIPLYNLYVLLTIVGRPGWWLILYFIPVINVVIELIVLVDLAKSFGKGVGFGLGLFFLGFIFFPVLGLGSARYVGPAAA